MYRCLLFHPNGDIENYVGIYRPKAEEYPLGTWRHNRNTPIHLSKWCINAVYDHVTDWEYSDDVKPPKKFQMIALVHP